ncbi:inovirus-type Gp2 protein [Neptuniibacter sp. QD37_6]|uniref:YagK/YfjJ domain-containing protein n=1 Tax=Neptuniibacter sp. QD37_6 TaxID=3398210 RepID=UPI0039F45045
MFDYEEIDKIVDDKWGYEVIDDKVYVTEDRDISRILLRVDKAVRNFRLSDYTLNLNKSSKRNFGELIFKKIYFGDKKEIKTSNKQIKCFFDCYLSMRGFKKRGLFKVRAHSPHITAYLQWMDDIERSVVSFDKIRSIHGETVNYNDLEHRIYKCFERLSEKLSEPKFQKLILKSKQTTDKNYRSMLSYIDKLFKKRSRLLVVRVDLSYKAEIADICRRASFTMADHVSEFEQVKADLERLLRNRRHNKIFRGLLGYIWKLEHGVLRGYHYHVVFFFDGAIRRGDIW